MRSLISNLKVFWQIKLFRNIVIPILLLILIYFAYAYLFSSEKYSHLLPVPMENASLGMTYEDFTNTFSLLNYRDKRGQRGKRVDINFQKRNEYRYFDNWSFYFDETNKLYLIEGENTELTSNDKDELGVIMSSLVENCNNAGLYEDWGNRSIYTNFKDLIAYAKFENKDTDIYKDYYVLLQNDINRIGNCLKVVIRTNK